MRTKLKYHSDFNDLTIPKHAILLYDHRLQSIASFSLFLNRFDRSLALEAGEELKSLANFERILPQIFELCRGQGRSEILLVAIGGGSVGDFVGFAASVLLRGVRLIHIPSTWLSAIDSSHGGKTALNTNQAKNQIGTFYPAESVCLVKSLLVGNPEELAEDALGELVKMGLVTGGELWESLTAKRDAHYSDYFWMHLSKAIDGKYHIVDQDPFEQKGIREILNLGHTLGHALEKQLSIPHGKAVFYGLDFAVEFSKNKGLLKIKDYNEIKKFLESFGEFRLKSALPLNLMMSLIEKDKKRINSKELNFVFLERPGKAVVKPIYFSEIAQELLIQGWCQ
jgi:3-dehydroquinate synthase